MINKTLEWKSVDNLNIFAQYWQPQEAATAVVTLVHGFGEHSSRYAPYIEYFTQEQIAFVAFDLRGHGKSEGKQGVTPSYKVLLNDIEVAIEKTKELFPNIPHFIYGHSMGGNLAFNYLIQRKPKLTGAIITSPWFVLADNPNSFVRGAVSVLSHIFPNITITGGLDANYMSSLESEVEKYKTDPLNHGKISFLMFTEISKNGQYAIANSNQCDVPVLMMQGSADKVTSVSASKKVAEGNKKMIEFKIWENKNHELHNEDVRQQLAETVINKIKELCKK